jgi:DNA-binding HxlR family transcriptional regulator
MPLPKSKTSKTPRLGTIPEDAFAHGPFSPRFHNAAELVGKRWTAAIIYSLFHGLNRFTDLVNAIPGVSSRMLTERLKELEVEGIIERSVYAETPVRIEYTLTKKGLALREVFIALNKWAIKWDQSKGN